MDGSNVNVDGLNGEVAAFARTLDDLYGHYLDCVAGFARLAEMIQNAQSVARHTVPSSTDLDGLPMFIGRGDPNDPSHVLQHSTTQGEYRSRNMKGGANHIRAGQLFVVLVYSFWETGHRRQIASACGLADPDSLKVPILGDLRRLRHDIVHHGGAITKETTAKLEVLTDVIADSVIAFSERDIEVVVRKIKESLDSLVVRAGGSDPELRTIWHVH